MNPDQLRRLSRPALAVSIAAILAGTVGVLVSSNAADPAYCAQRYRSYDPASNTYLGYDGWRHTCGE